MLEGRWALSLAMSLLLERFVRHGSRTKEGVVRDVVRKGKERQRDDRDGHISAAWPADDSRPGECVLVPVSTADSDAINAAIQDIRQHIAYCAAQISALQNSLSTINIAPPTTQIKDMKRELQSVHREMERVWFEVRGAGGAIENRAREATRTAWGAYRRAVKVEEGTRGIESRETGCIPPRSRDQGSGVRGGEVRQVYVPTGAGRKQVSSLGKGIVMRKNEGETRTSEGADGGEQEKDVFAILSVLPQLIAQGLGESPPEDDRPRRFALHHSSSFTSVESQSSSYDGCSENESNLVPFPQPRFEVTQRIRYEEASGSIGLNAPDTRRRGSCAGETVTLMVLTNAEAPTFVLPYLHHIKPHEARTLRDWLISHGLVTQSYNIGRSEKLLCCIQLLQTGSRYESIAVQFSRSPRQVKSACLEVFQGLLHLYGLTHVETVEQAQVHDALWGICRKFVKNGGCGGGAAQMYYGFSGSEVERVLVALNLFIGRFRRQGVMAFEGPVWEWARYLIGERVGESGVGHGEREGGAGRRTEGGVGEGTSETGQTAKKGSWLEDDDLEEYNPDNNSTKAKE